MGKFFLNPPQKGRPLAQDGLAEGWAKLAEAFEQMEIVGGHIEWKRGYIPRIVIDNQDFERDIPIVIKKPFDILNIDSDTGMMILTRCKWQTQEKYYSHADISLTAQTGTVCAVLDTTDGTLTAQMDYVWVDTAPELIPYALYDITVSTVDEKQVVVIDCDRRGSAITFYG